MSEELKPPTTGQTSEEIEKAQKLEAARKKFEELKKKKKKNNKKNKKKTETSATTEENSDFKETTPIVDDGLEEPVSEKVAIPEDSATETKAKQGPEEEPEQESTAEQVSEVDDKSELKKASKMEINDKTTPPLKEEPQEEPQEELKEGKTLSTENSKLSTDTTSRSIHFFDTNDNTPLEEILSSDTPQESDFLTSTLKSQVAELTKQLKESEAKVSQLKEENSELKLTQMDLEEEIETLKHDLENSKLQAFKSKSAGTSSAAIAYAPQRQNEGLVLSEDDNNSIFSTGITPDFIKPSPSFQNFTNFANKSNDYLDIVDFKERLAQWKGWNVDMREWRTVGMGPTLEL